MWNLLSPADARLKRQISESDSAEVRVASSANPAVMHNSGRLSPNETRFDEAVAYGSSFVEQGVIPPMPPHLTLLVIQSVSQESTPLPIDLSQSEE